MQFCGDLPLLIHRADTSTRYIAPRDSIKTIETAKMALSTIGRGIAVVLALLMVLKISRNFFNAHWKFSVSPMHSPQGEQVGHLPQVLLFKGGFGWIVYIILARLSLAESLYTQKRDTRKSVALVRIKGLEPPRLSASDPKSDVATNYTISAGSRPLLDTCRVSLGGAKVKNFCNIRNFEV